MADWTIADRISDRIVEVLNDELTRMGDDLEPLQLLAGELFALKALQRTMPTPMPPSLIALHIAVDAVLLELHKTTEAQVKH